jgi:hypothetical protein
MIILYDMKQVISALILVLVGAVVSQADVYRYEDDNGVVCYTDAPFNKKAERVIKTDIAEPARVSQNISTRNDFHGIVHEKANKYEIDPSLVHAVIKTESNGNPRAISRKGAMGLMQLMPTTAQDLEVRNPFDPEENIEGGTRYLKYLIERFRGDLTLALAAYNAGPKTVEKTGSVPHIPETKEYVRRVLSLYNGRTFYPASSTGLSVAPKQEPIYKILTDDGTVLFTNTPFYKKSPRF